jgi:hypothetical protein
MSPAAVFIFTSPRASRYMHSFVLQSKKKGHLHAIDRNGFVEPDLIVHMAFVFVRREQGSGQ